MKRESKKAIIFDAVPVYCIRKKEAAWLSKEVPGYLQHGISVSSGDIVFDVGANIGVFSLWLHLQQNAQLTIYAFEPIAPIAEVLSQNVAEHAPDNIKVMQVGLGKKEEKIAFTYYPKATMWSTGFPLTAYNERSNTRNATIANLKQGPLPFRMIPAVVWETMIDLVLNNVFRRQQSFDCAITTVSAIMHSHALERIDLLKIDAEYAEWDILQGIETRHWSKIKQVVMELHDIDDRLQKIKSLLQQQGFHNITATQQDILTNTNIYQLYASRQYENQP
jgi:FkbM family methyltransferase